MDNSILERTLQALEAAATLCRELQEGRGNYSKTDYQLLAIAFEGDAERFKLEKERFCE